MLRSGYLHFAVLASVLALVAGCAGGPPAEPDPPRPVLTLPPDCTRTVAERADLVAAVATVSPGETVCVVGESLAGLVLELRRSGTSRAPVTLAGDGAVLGGIHVEADHVVVQGLSFFGGPGIEARGAGLVLRGNTVHEAQENGIVCAPCTDALVGGNVVRRADGSGLLVSGSGITVRDNTITDSVRRTAGDADGIRFFGDRIRIIGNTISDIKDDGYPGSPPHTDCFQTYDNSAPATTDVLISGNTCRNVDHQCLIATAEEAGLSGRTGRSRGLRFADNVCEVEGSQAVLVRWFPGVEITGNVLSGPNLDRAAYFGDGSVDGRFTGNDTPVGVRPAQVDESSRSGFVAAEG